MNPPGEGLEISYTIINKYREYHLLVMLLYYTDSNPAMQAFNQNCRANAYGKTIS